MYYRVTSNTHCHSLLILVDIYTSPTKLEAQSSTEIHLNKHDPHDLNLIISVKEWNMLVACLVTRI